jgi:hypothetical protein
VTDRKFNPGDVVRLSSLARTRGIRLAKGERSGRVVGFTREGHPWVLWDEYVSRQAYHPDYLEALDPETIAARLWAETEKR